MAEQDTRDHGLDDGTSGVHTAGIPSSIDEAEFMLFCSIALPFSEEGRSYVFFFLSQLFPTRVLEQAMRRSFSRSTGRSGELERFVFSPDQESRLTGERM